MGLLKLVDDRPGIDLLEYRDQQYYGKYDYRCRITIEGLRRGYYFTPEEFENRLDGMGEYRSWGRIRDDEKKVIRDNLDSIKKVLQFRIDNRKNKSITIRSEFDTVSIFTNDLKLLHDSFDGIPNSKVNYTQVETNGYVGIKTFAKEPKHKFRVYFRGKKVPEDFKGKLSEIIKNNKQLRPSPALKNWLNPSKKHQTWYWWSNYLSSMHFIDYNDESYLSYLGLLYSDLLGKKYKLEKRPDII